MSGSAKPAHIASLQTMPPEWRGAVVAIGNFDGVHRGHQAVLAAARAEAERRGVACILLTLEPHPRAYFTGEPLFRLTPAPLKAAAAAALGLDGMLVRPFDQVLAGKEAEQFVRDVLVEALAISAVVTGYDFHFGKGRRGTPDFLRQQGRSYGFSVAVIGALAEGGGAVSSTRIRAALGSGDVRTANALLGWRFGLAGEVVHGDARGRQLGYPTANMAFDPAPAIALGIYAVRFLRRDGSLHDGVASYGRRPTFGDGQPLLETFLFDFSGDLYGEEAFVSFTQFLRPEESFPTAEALVRQMDLDSVQARSALQEGAPGELDRRLYAAWSGLGQRA